MGRVIASPKFTGEVEFFIDGQWYVMPGTDAGQLGLLLIQAASVAEFAREASVEQAEELLLRVQRRADTRPTDR